MKNNDPLELPWFPLKEYPNFEINKAGQIRNALSGKSPKIYHLTTGLGYVTIKNKEGKLKNAYIEQLVVDTFMPNADTNRFDLIKHKDGNINNCSVDNLIWTADDTAKQKYYSQTGKTKPDEYFVFYPLMEFPESTYEINKVGQIRNKRTHKMLKGTIDDGYLTYTLYINKKIVSRRAHCMVAKQFIPNPDNKTIVNHIDENRANSCIDNLEWITPSENSLFGTAQDRSNLSRNKPIKKAS